MLITAAIITYNRREMVRLAIESVLAQTFEDYELLIVDDGSTDGTQEVLQQYADRARIIIRDKNGGEMATRNTALAAARGDYLCFLDSDDAWFPWTLATFARAIQENDFPVVVSGSRYSFKDESEIGQVRQTSYDQKVSPNYFADDFTLAVCCAALKREEVQKAGGFVDRRLNCLDSDMVFRLGDHPYVRIQSPHTLAFRSHAGILANCDLSYGGIKYLIDAERGGLYPGGSALRAGRIKHITMRARSIAVQCAWAKRRGLAAKLYWDTFRWHLMSGRFKFLLGLPLMAVKSFFTGPAR